ncbi:ABC transporter substrate-binding protein [Deinococcus yavapaiensis]|uniref:Amino acid/amide ABC transporter substrate-binding protein (HAAT family) n=1 Tax=Deinococcus yavapaiensis KR-236 TaxID=694435 RepID=A0A318S801_9DEIO|nr:ABC transporter substrate-binding protein [Deinococcus yavapaiensis]PYE54144.1 amino acid/amide ABC transporter substrate-binding protein (HAAT family) [Deinococcus yavapaiensis KR-236]
MKKLVRFAALSALLAVAQATAQNVVNIGYSGPLSGAAAFYGKDVQSGLEMAVNEINKAGGITVKGQKYRLNLVSLDDRYLPNETATNVRRLLQQNNTPVIFVPHAGGILTVQAFNTRNPEFLLMAYSSDPSVVSANNALTVTLPPTFDQYLAPFAKTMMKQYGKRLGLLATTSAYGRAWADAMSAEWRKQGGTVVGNYGVDYNTTTDYNPTVTRALADKPDVMLIGGPSQPTALVVKAAREQGYKGGFMVMDQAKFEQMTAIASTTQLNGSIGVLPVGDYRTAGAQRFIKEYAKVFDNKVATAEPALNYLGLYMVARAMEIAGTTTDASAIRAAMPQAARTLKASQQLFGPASINERGQLNSQLQIALFRSGRIMPLNANR